MVQMTGIRYKGRQVRCNDADEKPAQSERPEKGRRKERKERHASQPKHSKKDNWRELINKAPRNLKGEEPDFSEEGWAMRKPRRKKK